MKEVVNTRDHKSIYKNREVGGDKSYGGNRGWGIYKARVWS